MTIVACWRDPQEFLWLAADTRISNAGPGGGFIIKTESGAKLSAIEIGCVGERGLDTGGRSYSTKLGFGFAGCVLPAVMTAMTASSLMSFITPLKPGLPPPGFLDLVEPIRVIGERFTREHYHAMPLKLSLFEAYITGFCARTFKARAAHIRPEIAADGEVHLITEELDLMLGPVAIGTGAKDFHDKLASMASLSHEKRFENRPLRIVEEMAKTGRGDVGGNLSFGNVGPLGFIPLFRLQPSGGPTFFFNGIDVLEDLPLVGEGHVLFSAGM